MVLKALFWIFTFWIFYTYFGYYLFLLIVSLFKKRERKTDDSYFPSVTMVVSAFNEEKVITDKIKNCLELDYPEDKIKFFIGSDGSEDNTNEILHSIKSAIIKAFLFEQRRGKAAVLNDLVRRANSDILLFSDANTIYDKESVRNLVKYFVDRKIGGVCGRLDLQPPNDDIGGKGETLYWNYENQIKNLEGKIKTVFGANGAIYAIRTELYEKLPESKVIMDDFLIPLNIVKKGFDVVFEKNAVGKEHASSHIHDEYKRKVRIGAANFNALSEIWQLLLPTKGFVSFGLWSHKIIRWFAPFLLVFILVLNVFLLGSPLYNAIFIAQLIFYTVAFYGFLMSVLLNKRVKLISYGYYFISMNLALMQGFIKFLFKTQKPTWVKAER